MCEQQCLLFFVVLFVSRCGFVFFSIRFTLALPMQCERRKMKCWLLYVEFFEGQKSILLELNDETMRMEWSLLIRRMNGIQWPRSDDQTVESSHAFCRVFNVALRNESDRETTAIWAIAWARFFFLDLSLVVECVECGFAIQRLVECGSWGFPLRWNLVDSCRSKIDLPANLEGLFESNHTHTRVTYEIELFSIRLIISSEPAKYRRRYPWDWLTDVFIIHCNWNITIVWAISYSNFFRAKW